MFLACGLIDKYLPVTHRIIFFKKLNANLFSELVEGNGDGNVLFVPNEYADTENDYASEIGEDSLNDQAKEEAFKDYYDQLLTNVVWKKPLCN